MSTPKIDVRALAALARLEISDEEVARLERELPSILSFVEQVQKAHAEAPETEPMLKNVMREDTNPHKSGIYTKRLLDAAPAQLDDQVVVKQVLRQK